MSMPVLVPGCFLHVYMHTDREAGNLTDLLDLLRESSSPQPLLLIYLITRYYVTMHVLILVCCSPENRLFHS